MASPTLPVVTGDKDRSLQEALGAPDGLARRRCGPDADPIVTAARRLPAVAASYAPFPDGTDPRLRAALAARGDRAALHASGRGVRARRSAGRNVVTITPTASGKTLCYNAPVLRRDPQGSVDARAVSVSDQGARAGSARRAARAVRARRRSDGGGEIGVFTYDGDTPRTRGARFAARRTSCSATPTCCTRGSCRTIRAGRSCSRTCSSSSSTSCTRIAACSAATSANILRRLQRVCRHYGSDPIFICSSATIANPRELAERLTGASVRAGREERRAARREVLPVRQSAGRQRAARHPALVSRRDAARRARVPEAQPAADPLRAEPPRRPRS